MIVRQLVGPGVAVAEMRADTPAPIPFPEEERAVRRACARRRREFASGRACARQALVSLGAAPVPIPKGRKGEPLWPPGLVGSITHCQGLRAAAVARAEDVVSLGIDAEVNAPLPRGVFERIACGEELALRGPAELDGVEAVHRDRLLFSAKESIYKAWFQLRRCWLGFSDARVSVDLADTSFRCLLRVPGPWVGGVQLQELRGRWTVGEGLLASAVVIPSGGGLCGLLTGLRP
ncbi:MAG TPA: 4'-phosphopantetheinyl transferase superfamily protein [Solirubrobacterales bacterium]